MYWLMAVLKGGSLQKTACTYKVEAREPTSESKILNHWSILIYDAQIKQSKRYSTFHVLRAWILRIKVVVLDTGVAFFFKYYAS